MSDSGEKCPIQAQKVTDKEDGRYSIDMQKNAEIATIPSSNAIKVAESAEKLPIEDPQKAASRENYSFDSQKVAESAEKLPIKESDADAIESSKKLPIKETKVTDKDGKCPIDAQKVTDNEEKRHSTDMHEDAELAEKTSSNAIKVAESAEKLPIEESKKAGSGGAYSINTQKNAETAEKLPIKEQKVTESSEKLPIKESMMSEMAEKLPIKEPKVTVKNGECPIEAEKVTVKEDERHSTDMHENAEIATIPSSNAIKVAESAEKLPIEDPKKAGWGENYSFNSQKIAESAEKLPIKEPKVSESSKMLPIKISVESYTQAYLDKGYSEPTVLNLNAVYDDIEVNQVFDSAYLMKILECSERTARGLLVKLKEMNVVISVVGKGKGRGRKIFRFKYETEVSEI